ncbi:hypothetical protein [Hyphomicrobium sp. ghe19]|uniref:hypothetical protein n=1 Tax=Hyphomicrobium sp. ghe19 TaxID=2682968 RepID=UPI0013671545|nr:hypothetical protein HYPP_02648 [Hyphomicrobium sp. ghe19]
MARSFHNIDTPWRKGADYIGYAGGEIFHIRKVMTRAAKRFTWRAVQVDGYVILWGDTLGEISGKLEGFSLRRNAA